MAVHPTAIVDPQSRISAEADIGPYCIVGPEVEIGANTHLIAHVVLEGPATVGQENTFFPYSNIAVAPQDLKYAGERSEVRIGNRNRIREFVTIHRGTEGGGRITSLGDDNLVMAYAHVAHDARIANHTVLSHGATCGGHVIVEDWAVIGAFTGIHQFCRIGQHAMIGGYSVITQDVLPFSITVSEREVKVFGANKTGMERRGFSPETIESLRKALRLLTHAGLNTTQALERIHTEVESSPELNTLLEFIRSSERGFIK